MAFAATLALRAGHVLAPSFFRGMAGATGRFASGNQQGRQRTASIEVVATPAA
jgi:hypothetical protein